MLLLARLSLICQPAGVATHRSLCVAELSEKGRSRFRSMPWRSIRPLTSPSEIFVSSTDSIAGSGGFAVIDLTNRIETAFRLEGLSEGFQIREGGN